MRNYTRHAYVVLQFEKGPLPIHFYPNSCHSGKQFCADSWSWKGLNKKYIFKTDIQQLSNIDTVLDCLQSLKQFFINVSYHILVASLTLMALLKQSHQSKTGYKYIIWHIDEKLF